jgi:hypothetical protein
MLRMMVSKRHGEKNSSRVDKGIIVRVGGPLLLALQPGTEPANGHLDVISNGPQANPRTFNETRLSQGFQASAGPGIYFLDTDYRISLAVRKSFATTSLQT